MSVLKTNRDEELVKDRPGNASLSDSVQVLLKGPRRGQ